MNTRAFLAIVLLASAPAIAEARMFAADTRADVEGIAEGDYLPVHTGPSEETPVIGRLPHDATNIHVSRCDISPRLGETDWCEIAHEGMRGWVNAAALAPTVYLKGQ